MLGENWCHYCCRRNIYHAAVDIEKIVRNTIKEIGYDHSRLGFDGNTCCVLNILGKQSANIADGIRGHSMEELGAGDQASPRLRL